MVKLDLYPSVKHLHAAAKKKLPKFSFDYVEGGTGLEAGLKRNRDALDATTINPKYINDWPSLDTEVNLFGRNFSYPFGIAPMGLASLQWPKAELIFAEAAQKANIPVGLSTSCTVAIEEFGAMPVVTAGSNFILRKMKKSMMTFLREQRNLGLKY